jgi:hypothetical protein
MTPDIKNRQLFERAYRSAEETFYPNGPPKGADPERMRYRILLATLEDLRRQRAFVGNVEEAAKALKIKSLFSAP